MIEYFRQRPPRDSTVNLEAKEWPRFASTEDIRDEKHIPAIIWKYGPHRRVCFEEKAIKELAFDEEEGHLSHLFAGRMIRVHVGKWIEECVVTHAKVDPVEKVMYFLRLARLVPGQLTELEIPVTMIGLLGCPAYLAGYHVELAMPKIKCEVVGDKIPPPFQLDVSGFKYKEPYNAITLQDLQHLLPGDGTVRFSRDYDVASQEVAWTYEVGKLPEQPLPRNYVDPNFLTRTGRRQQLTYKGYFPKQ
eukprot:GDKI01027364.1.p1 GENE.GDKI01027364.1~~GDKI01027364.1.p1  ORF type:complete len:277 (+),score=64.64 GDKI01027364.1:91-831(+)